MTHPNFDQVKIKFEKFLSLLSNILPCEREVHVIRNNLRRHFNTTVSDYLCSKEFSYELEHIHQLFMEKKSVKYYSLLSSFDERMKNHSIKTLPKSIPSPIPKTPICTSSTMEILPSTRSNFEVQETLAYLVDQCSNIPNETLVIDQVISLHTGSNHERKIRRLEQRLHRLSKIIQDLEEKEMSLDEMAHCDLYEVESNLKQQACQIYQRLVTLKSQSPSIERILHQPIVLNESEIGHPLISQDLQTMVNQSKNFPCFNDVLKTVDDANEKHRLHFNEEMRRQFAEKSFKIIGREIKTRRMADFHDIMSSRLPKDFNIEQSDPALNNAEIEQVLQDNHRDATIKTEKIFEEFARIDPGPETEINLDCTDDELEVQATTTEFEATNEISLQDRTLTILSTASLPTHNLPSSTIVKDQQVETLIPRHRSSPNDNEIIYQLYRQRLTNQYPVSNKRSFTETSNAKRTKSSAQPEIIVLD